MASIAVLADLLSCKPLKNYTDSSEWFTKRDEIKQVLASHLEKETTAHWLGILEPADIWCAKVMNYEELVREEGYKILNMELEVNTSNGLVVTTTRCPIKVDGEILSSTVGAPLLGEHNRQVEQQFCFS
jgi:crotonobetainyl-CoA:carnitine CoA-transferase CaiB-like acyl-CoA transferase